MGLKDLMVRIRADNSELDKAVIESSRKLEQVGKRLDRMGRSLSLNVTAPILALGGAAIVSSIKFEDAMAGVAKTVDVSAETITALGDEFKALSEQIPVAATELANIGEAAGQLGIATNNILGFTRVIADLGVATNLTSTEAATDLARLANITGMPQNEFDRLGSTVVALGNNLATTEREIVAMGLRLTGAGTQVGLTEDQILALAASLSSVGIEAESGGTALSKVMAEMAIAVGDGGEKLEQFAQIAGMSGAEFAKAFEEDAADALVTFTEGIGRLSDEGVNVFQVLESVEFGNIRVRDALLRASSAGDLMRKSLDLGSQAWLENTALTIEAAKFYATLGNQIKKTWNEVVNMAAEMGDNLKPAMLALIAVSKPMLGLLRDMIKGFSELPAGIQAVAIGLVALTAAAGPALIVLASLTTAFAVLKGAAALGGLAALVGPGSLILLGLAGLSAVFLALTGRIDDATESQKAFTTATQEATESQEIASAKLTEAMARKRLATAERNLLFTPLGDREQLRVGLDRVRQFKEELNRASEELERLQTGGAGRTPATAFDLGSSGADKQAALGKQLQDRLVAMTKTAVDDMQLEFDRLRAHVIEVDGAISADWAKVLDGMKADIAKVGLREGFAAELEALGASVDGLGDHLMGAHDGANAAFEALFSLRNEILDTTGGAEEFKTELAQIEAILKRLQGKIGVEFDADTGDIAESFFGGLKDQAKSILDPSAIVSTALGNLLSGGLSTVISSVVSGMGGLFGGGPSALEQERIQILKSNNAALIELTRTMDGLQGLINVPGGLIGAAQSGLQFGPEGRVNVGVLQGALEQSGFSVRDLEKFSKEELGITLFTQAGAAIKEGFAALNEALEEFELSQLFDGFSGQMNLAQRRFDLFDIQAPAEKLSVLQDLFEQFTNLPAPTNTEAILELFEQFASGGIKFGDLDKLTGSQFLDMLSDMEGLFDDLGDSAKGANAALRNVPAGFKVAAARFRATDPEPFAPPEPPPILPPITPPPPLPPDDALREIMDALTGSGGVGDTITDALAGLNDLGTVKDALAGGLNDSSGLGTMKDMLAGRLNDSSGWAGGNMTDRLGLGGGASDQPVTNNYIFQGDINLPDVQDPDEFLLQIEQQARWRGRTGGGVLETNEQR